MKPVFYFLQLQTLQKTCPTLENAGQICLVSPILGKNIFLEVKILPVYSVL